MTTTAPGVDTSERAVELVCDNLYGASCSNGELDAARQMMRALRRALTASEKLLEQVQSLRSYKAGDVSPHSDVYLVADMRNVVAKQARAILTQGETK